MNSGVDIFTDEMYGGFPSALDLCQEGSLPIHLFPSLPYPRPWGVHRTMDRRFDNERIAIRAVAHQEGCTINLQNGGEILLPPGTRSKRLRYIMRVSDHLDGMYHLTEPGVLPPELSPAVFHAEWSSPTRILNRLHRADNRPPPPPARRPPVRAPEEQDIDFGEFLQPSIIEEWNAEATPPPLYETEPERLEHPLLQKLQTEEHDQQEALRKQVTTAFKPMAIAVGALGDLVDGEKAKPVARTRGTRARDKSAQLEKYISHQIQDHIVEGNNTNTQPPVGLARNDNTGPVASGSRRLVQVPQSTGNFAMRFPRDT